MLNELALPRTPRVNYGANIRSLSPKNLYSFTLFIKREIYRFEFGNEERILFQRYSYGRI